MSDPRENTITLSRPVFGMLVMSIVVLFVVCVGLAITVQANARNIDHLEGQVADLTETAHQTQTSVDRLTTFVDELEAPPPPDEVAQDEAISNAVRLVPEIRDILCEQFPQATACNVP